MPSYHTCALCQRGIHGECRDEDACACLACRCPTDDEIADAPTSERITAPDDDPDEEEDK